MNRALFRVSFKKLFPITFSVMLQPASGPVRCVASGLSAWAAMDKADAVLRSGEGRAWTVPG